MSEIEPEYITTEDDFSGPHGDVREDFIARVSGTPAVRGFWRCPFCKLEFARRASCAGHLAFCGGEWITLSDRSNALVIRAANAMFTASKRLMDRMRERPTTLAQRIDDMGAEMALLEMLVAHPELSAASRQKLIEWDPLVGINTFAKIPDLPVGPGVEVRHILKPQHRLTIRDSDHKERIFANMLGHFPRYGFAGFALFAEIEDVRSFRQDYGHRELEAVYAIPRHLKSYDLAALARRCS